MIPLKRTPTSLELHASAWEAIKNEVEAGTDQLVEEGWKTIGQLSMEWGKTRDATSGFCNRQFHQGKFERTHFWNQKAKRVLSYFRPIL